MKFKQIIFAVVVASLMFSTTAALASLSASASFSIVGGNLQVVLTNTSPDDVLVPTEVLTGVFFSIPNTVALTPLSALLTSGSVVFFGSNGGGNVGGEWGYAQSAALAPANSGISSAGLGVFGGANFNGPDLDPPAALDGLNYGITSAGDNTATGNAEVTGNVPLIKNSVTFTLGITGTLVPTSDITNVRFQYGTALTPGTPVPAPAAMVLGMIGLGLVGWAKRRYA